MAYGTIERIQQWLETTKMPVSTVDSALDVAAANFVLNTVSIKYDTSTWVDNTTTPVQVLEVICLYEAAWMYERQYSEDGDNVDKTYGALLEARAAAWLAQITSGELDIGETIIDSGNIIFYPTDLQNDNADNTDSDKKFTMGTMF